MPSYTTATLLDIIKRKAMIPTTQSTFSDTDLLNIATEEVHNTILPAIMNTREEFYVFKEETPIDGGVTSIFPIPSRSVGMTLRELSLSVGGVERNMPRYEIEDKIYDFKSSYSYGFFIKNNNIHLLGKNTGTLNMYYYLRPGDLTLTSNCTTVVSTDKDLKQITVNNIPTGWVVGSEIDAINHRPGFETIMLGNPIAGISGTDITFENDLPTDQSGNVKISSSNWLALESTSPVPQMPVEFFQYLGEAVTAYVMESQGDQEGFARAQQRMSRMLESAQKTISPRVDGESKKFVSRRNRGANNYNHWKWY